MDFDIKIGSKKERTIKTDSNQTTNFLWEGENVLSTPSMISEMEETCRLLLKEYYLKDKEWDSVGTVVNIKHLATTPVGSKIKLNATVDSVDGRKVMFNVDVYDELEKIGEGKHERFIINIPRFRSKFEDKKKKC
ncbi:MAG: thioesterase family protein [Nitrososphaerales archaeon]